MYVVAWERPILFLRQLATGPQHKIFLILDNLRVHHSKPVKDWLADNKGKIEAFFLPAYSPGRNPDEYLNCDLKQGLPQKPAPKNAEKLREGLTGHMEMLAQDPDRARKYSTHEDIRHAA